jgi:hypothetical protein
MAFRPLNREEGKIVEVGGTASEAYTLGAALVITSGYYTAAASSTATDVIAIAMETKTITNSGDPLKVLLVDPTILFEADCDAVWSVVDVGTFADLATASTVDPDTSSNDIFKIVKGVGTAETDTKVVGYFTRDVTAS